MNKISDLFCGYRELAEKRELDILHPNAAFSKDHSRRLGPEDDHRLPYKRDVDRILHSKAYSRYVDRVQVFSSNKSDHTCHRSLLVQLVSNFARGIGEILGLNLDLIEAIALGHDVGHPPFGQEGETFLSQVSKEYDNGPFAHPVQSCRLLSLIEPLNLGLAIYDGFLCHDGAMNDARLVPNFGKTWQDHDFEVTEKKKNLALNIVPATLEGCLVKLCESMSYLGRDIEEAVRAGVILRGEVPKTILGQTNREILSYLAQDIIKHSFEKHWIEISEEALEALRQIRKFNFERIYYHPDVKLESEKIQESYRVLFERLLKEFRSKGRKSYLHKNFLWNKPKGYIEATGDVQKIVDYISGMTDSAFIQTLQDVFVPTKISVG